MRGALLLLCAATPALAAPDPWLPTSPDTQASLRLGRGIDFTTTDGFARLNLRARMQLRFSQFSAEDGEAPEVSEFQARRVRLLAQGHVYDGAMHYYLQLGFSNLDTEADLRLPLRDAYVTYTRVRDLHIRGGQMKVPLGRQRVVSSSALQMVERSIVVGELNLDRDVGVQVLSDDLFGLGGKLAYNAGVFSGDGRNRLASAPGVMAVARVAVRPFGAFDDFVESDHARSAEPRLAIAIAAAHNRNTNRRRSTFTAPYQFARFDYSHVNADLIFKYRGFSVISELIYRRASEPFVEQMSPTGDLVREYARNAWGFYAQGG
jgi:hypothetical protein